MASTCPIKGLSTSPFPTVARIYMQSASCPMFPDQLRDGCSCPHILDLVFSCYNSDPTSPLLSMKLVWPSHRLRSPLAYALYSFCSFPSGCLSTFTILTLLSLLEEKTRTLSISFSFGLFLPLVLPQNSNQ